LAATARRSRPVAGPVPRLQRPRVGGWMHPVVVQAVGVVQRPGHPFVDAGVVQGIDLDRKEGAAGLRYEPMPVERHAAAGAEAVVDVDLAPVLAVIAQRPGALQQLEVLGRRAPAADLAAVGAVAPARSRRQVQRGLVTDGTAMAASLVGPVHPGHSALAASAACAGSSASSRACAATAAARPPWRLAYSTKAGRRSSRPTIM